MFLGLFHNFPCVLCLVDVVGVSFRVVVDLMFYSFFAEED